MAAIAGGELVQNSINPFRVCINQNKKMSYP